MSNSNHFTFLHMSKYYQPSGKFSPLSFLYFLIACIVGIPILAYLYTTITLLIPFPYINFFITIGFGFAVAILVQFLAINLGKVRNGMIALLFGFLGGLWAYYCQWGFWLHNAGGLGDILSITDILGSPGFIYELIGNIKEEGFWEMKGSRVRGTFLLIIWIIEALIIIGLSTLIPMPAAGRPFCEINNQWFKSKQLPAFNYLMEERNIINSLESGSMDILKEVSIAEDSDKVSHSLFTLFANETNENYLSIENKMATRNDKGEIEFQDTQVVEYIEISEELSNALNAYRTDIK